MNVAVLAGPPLLGYMLNWFLYGILCDQVYWYYLAFPKDNWPAKSLVIFIFVAETVQTLIMASDCWAAYAQGFGDEPGLGNIGNEWLAAPMLTAIISCVVQSFYAYRIYKLCSCLPLVSFIVTLSIVQLVGGLITGAQSIHAIKWSNLKLHPHLNKGLWLGATVLADVVIAVSMVYWLSKAPKSNAATQRLVSKLIRMIVETGAFTAVVAILTLVLFYEFPNKPIHSTPMNMLAKAYSVSAMAIFNNRIAVKLGSGDASDDISNLHISFAPGTAEIGLDSHNMVLGNKTGLNAIQRRHVEPSIELRRIHEDQSLDVGPMIVSRNTV